MCGLEEMLIKNQGLEDEYAVSQWVVLKRCKFNRVLFAVCSLEDMLIS
jgi:hypothetical protein